MPTSPLTRSSFEKRRSQHATASGRDHREIGRIAEAVQSRQRSSGADSWPRLVGRSVSRRGMSETIPRR
jgi:hypothetical protein